MPWRSIFLTNFLWSTFLGVFWVSRPFSCNEFKISPPPLPREYSNYPRVIGSNFLSCQGGTHPPSQKHPNLKFRHTCPYRITLPPPWLVHCQLSVVYCPHVAVYCPICSSICIFMLPTILYILL